jgi:hypothetical protein
MSRSFQHRAPHRCPFACASLVSSMEKFSFGQQVFVEVDGQLVRGTIAKIEKDENGDWRYYVASSEAPVRDHGPLSEDQIRAG